jgi:Beta xylosidase C-terminal Concanavalin A-like domain
MYRYRTHCLVVLASLLAMNLSAHSAWASSPASDQAGPLASSFPGPLWEVVTPEGGTASVANAHLTLKVPGGSNHDTLMPSNQAVRVVQPIGNNDFDVSIKIDSPILATEAGTSQGLMVLADDVDFITFALVTDGTNISLTAHTVTGGVATTVFDQASFNEYHNPICLRLNRTGSSYTAYYSVDGVVWTQATSFTDTRVPTSIGPFAGNYNSNPTKAVPVVMAINWFDVL